jgi:hypothetical protein
MRRDETKELIAELDSQSAFLHSDVVNGGNASGVYAHELLAVSYAGWISPSFQLKVNQAFLDMRHGSHPKPLPTFFNPSTKIAIETLMRVDAVEQEVARLATEARQANLKADMAMSHQQWQSIREYTYFNSLEHQLPPSSQQAYAAFLLKYCAENGIPVRAQFVPDRPWEKENSYHVDAIARTLGAWLIRRDGQANLLPMARKAKP